MLLIHVDVNVSVSHHSYTSIENDSSVLVCLSVTENLRKDVAIRLDTKNGTAIGNVCSTVSTSNLMCVCVLQ